MHGSATTRRHTVVGATDGGKVIVCAYEDGDVVVNHGARGNCVEMAGVSGYGPILNACDRLDVPEAETDAVLDFVHEQADFISQ
jgi:hypothetical protein